jgi:hypothetical protein
MASDTIGKKIGDFLRYELPHEYCRARITVAKSQTVVIGAVLDRDGATQASPIANGSEANADAIALEDCTTGAGATGTVLALVRGPAIIDGDQLVLAANVTVAELVAPLLALGILVRTEPTIYTAM